MKEKETAAQLHVGGFNCAQCVAYLCRDCSGIDRRTALSAMNGFGGGLRCGEVCGALAGGVYTLGLARPFDDPADKGKREELVGLTNQLTDAFQKKFGALSCRELTENFGRTHCEEFMDVAAELVHEILGGAENDENL